ncbi:MAG: DUF4307 domain-containing protein [Microcella sp.]|uniref:DUF4307 domain-containing protein n=1 Tax=Microcella sp. TaxID=1913979 RepID=UPI0033155048
MTTTQQLLDERYGRTVGSERRTRRILIIGAIALAGVLTAWVVWGGLSGTSATLETRELGYADATDMSITVQWEVSAPPGTPVQCALQALNSSFGIVGWRIVEIPPSEERTRAFAQTIQTSEPAVTGLPYRCWLP